MSVLGTIAKRLQTDIADIARATIDPQFSRELDRRESRTRAFQEQEEFRIRQEERQRDQAAIDQDNQLKLKTQFLLVNQAIEEGISRGNWEPLGNITENSQNLNPILREYGRDLINARLPQGFEYAKQAADMQLKARNATSAELANVLKAKGLEQRERQHIRNIFLQKQKLNWDKAQADYDRAVETGDVEVVKNFFKTSDMLTEEERSGWLRAVEGNISADQATNVMNKFLDQQRVLQQQELKNQARSTRNPNEFQAFKYFNDDYQQQSKPMRNGLRLVGEIRNLLSQENQSGATDKALNSKVTELFSTSVRALQELEQWKNLGDLGERVAGSINRFVTGKRTQAQRNDLMNLINDFEKELDSAHKRSMATTMDQAGEFVDPELIFPGQTQTRYIQRQHSDGRTFLVDTWKQEIVREITGE